MRVLDLGCGTALSSMFLAREFDVQVWAADLWVSPHDNWDRVVAAGLDDRVFAIYAEAHALPFSYAFFDAIVSIDAYHYFGTDEGYLGYLATFAADGAPIGIVVPGCSTEVDEWRLFRSADWWATLWSGTSAVEVEHAEMIPDGWNLWWRFLELEAAWSGTPPEDEGDAALLLAPNGKDLGFSRVVARRRLLTPP
jgi:cyclopropane fatty-acyl-phospholipid synthase-like methyltransferase